MSNNFYLVVLLYSYQKQEPLFLPEGWAVSRIPL